MLKFIWGKGHQPSAERLKIQKELFGFNKEVRHGFPHKPTALAYDDNLRLLAIATKQGILRIVGQPGVEFTGQHEDEGVIRRLLFLPGQGRIISLTEDNQLHLWEINGTKLEVKKTTGLEGRLKQISVLCLDSNNKQVLLGTEGGNIYILNLINFQIDENIIYQDIVMQNSPEDFKVNPGAVEALLIHPKENEKILIGYARGLIVLWDRSTTSAAQTYVASQQLEALAWRNDGSEFISSHNDGSYVTWSTSNADPLEPPNTPYGPYPCKAITNLYWGHDNGDSWLIFTGGMPRASYGDKFTVTVMKGEDQHTVFDLSSKIVDFSVISESHVPTCLIILSEEELVLIDLTTDHWPIFSLPYLNPIHASAITCITHVTDIPLGIYERITQAGTAEHQGKVSDRNWPISGGSLPKDNQTTSRDILITGHEDGSVKVWSVGGVAMSQILTIKTNKFFVGDDLDEPREDDEESEEEWPPFRKVGHFDPYSDDPRLAVKKVAFCPTSGRLFIGGTAGQVVILELMDSDAEITLQPIKADLVTEKEGFVWKGHSSLTVRSTELKLVWGYQPSCILQVSPPASINSLGFSKDWGLLAAGTAHGLVILDCFQNVVVLAKCTLSAQDIANADDNPMSRRKSFKKSLRESFRRLRKGRSQRNNDKKKAGQSLDPIKKELRSDSPETRPVERAIEARTGSEDGLGSMVRCLHFSRTCIANPQTLSSTLWAGTNSGQILVFLLTIPAGNAEKRNTEKVTAMLAKEIQLRHKAPVITVQVIDANGVPVSDSCESSDTSESSPLPHRVFISSEEQFKLFLLPTLKPCGKYKLTAHEGSRIRKVGFTNFKSKADPTYSENCLVCLTNQGELAVHSLPELRRQVMHTSCMKKEDVQAISTLTWTPKGEAFFLCSSSELQRISVAVAWVLEPKGTLTLAPGARPPVSELKRTPEKMSEDDAVVTRQNQLNEKEQAQGSKSSEDVRGQAAPGAPSDPHNETTISEISADITIDSVKDHTVNPGPSLPSLPEVVVHNVESSSIVKSSTTVTSTKVERIVTSEVTQMNGETTVNGIVQAMESTTIENSETKNENDAANYEVEGADPVASSS